MTTSVTPHVTLKTRVVRGVFWTSVETSGRQILALVVYAALARLVAPEWFGLVALGIVYVSFAEIFVTQGFGVALIQRRDLEDGHLDAAFWISMTMAGALTVATLLLADWVASIFHEPRLASVLRWLSVSLLLAGLSAVPKAALTREMKFRPLAARSLLATLTGGVIGLAMAWQGFGVWSLVAQQLSGAAVAAAVLWWATTWRPSFPPSSHHIRDLYRFAAAIAGDSLLWLATNRTDQTIIGLGFGAAALGPYALANRCVQLTMDAVATPVQVVALPALSRIQMERDRVQSAFYRLTETLAAIALPTLSGIAVLAPTLVPLLFGPRWTASVAPLRALAIYGILYIPVSFVHPLTLAIGKPRVALILSVCHTALTISLCLLAMRWSPLAVAGAVCVSMAISSVMSLTVCARLTGISIRMLGSHLWAPALASTIMSTAVLGFQYFARERLGDLLTAVGGIALGATIYGAGLVVLRRELLRQLSQLVSTHARPKFDRGDC